MENDKNKFKKLNSLKMEELMFILKLSEERLEETIVTSKEHRVRLNEIIKFSIPILGAIFFQLSQQKTHDNNETSIIIIFLFGLSGFFTIILIIWATFIYLPEDVAVKGRKPSKMTPNMRSHRKSIISVIELYEESIIHNEIKNKKRAKSLELLTLTIIQFGTSIVLFLLVFLFISHL